MEVKTSLGYTNVMTTPYAEQLSASLDSNATRTAIVHRQRAWSYAEIADRGRRLAARLQLLGLSPGDRVALPLADRLPFVIAQLGVHLAGGVALPLNSRLPRQELLYFLTDSAAAVAIVDPEQIDLLEQLRADVPSLRHIVVGGLEEDGSATSYKVPPFSAGDPCLLVYSSGTTGWPKGIVHTQSSLACGLRALADCWRLTPDDRVVNVLPLFHVHGLCFATQMPLLTGASVLLEDGFQPARTLEAIGEATVFMAVPTIYYRFLDTPEFPEQARAWKRLRLCTCGSAPIRPEVLPQLEATLGRPVINRYGMTEAHVITSLPLAGPWPAGSVGLPLQGVEVAVRREDGGACPPGEVGAVWIRGPNLFGEYLNRPEETRAAFVNGWFETGDLGSCDAAGFLTLVGRKHDLIITGGFNVYPAVVERVLNEYQGVRESAVVGLPDVRKGERVAAFIVRDDQALDEAGVLAFCQDRLVDYQRPRTVVFMDELPRNSMGKVLRRQLRDEFDRASRGRQPPEVTGR